MARAIYNLTPESAAISFTLQGNLKAFKAIVQSTNLNVDQIQTFEKSTEFEPCLVASLVYDVAKTGHPSMLKFLLRECGMTPHLPQIIQFEDKKRQETLLHLRGLRKKLSQKLFNNPDEIRRFGRESLLTFEGIGARRSAIPDIPFSKALADQKKRLSTKEKRGLTTCIDLLKVWEQRTPLPAYVPPKLVSAQAYEKSYHAEVEEDKKRRNGTAYKIIADVFRVP